MHATNHAESCMHAFLAMLTREGETRGHCFLTLSVEGSLPRAEWCRSGAGASTATRTCTCHRWLLSGTLALLPHMKPVLLYSRGSTVHLLTHLAMKPVVVRLCTIASMPPWAKQDRERDREREVWGVGCGDAGGKLERDAHRQPSARV